MTETPSLVGRRLKAWCLFGGIALLIEGLSYVVLTSASMMIGVPPRNNVQYLDALAARSAPANLAYAMALIGDLAFVPATIAIYLALKNVNKTLVQVATGLVLGYVVIDITTFVAPALWLVALSQGSQTASVVSNENFRLAIVPWSQFFGWVEPPIAFAMYVLVLRKANLGRFARIFGVFLVMFSIIAGFSFIFPSNTALVNFQLPALAVYVLFFLGFGEAMLKLRDNQGLPHSATPH